MGMRTRIRNKFAFHVAALYSYITSPPRSDGMAQLVREGVGYQVCYQTEHRSVLVFKGPLCWRTQQPQYDKLLSMKFSKVWLCGVRLCSVHSAQKDSAFGWFEMLWDFGCFLVLGPSCCSCKILSSSDKKLVNVFGNLCYCSWSEISINITIEKNCIVYLTNEDSYLHIVGYTKTKEIFSFTC